MTLLDSAIYVDGCRVASPPLFELTTATIRRSGGFVWIDLAEPHESELRMVADGLHLHRLAVEDAIHAHQRGKLERFDDTLFVVLYVARYHKASEKVLFSELHAFVGPNYIVVIRREPLPELDAVRRQLEADPHRLRHGPLAVLHAILDMVGDQYRPIVEAVEEDIDEIEDQVFTGRPEVSQRIYELSREVITFQRAARSLVAITGQLEVGRTTTEGDDENYVTPLPGVGDVEFQRLMRDVRDHAVQVAERVDEFRQVLQSALMVHATLVSQDQTEAAKKVSSWAAVFFAPALVAGIYGMNFVKMPELHWAFGYPFAISLMLCLASMLYVWFKKAGWL